MFSTKDAGKERDPARWLKDRGRDTHCHHANGSLLGVSSYTHVIAGDGLKLLQAEVIVRTHGQSPHAHHAVRAARLGGREGRHEPVPHGGTLWGPLVTVSFIIIPVRPGPATERARPDCANDRQRPHLVLLA